ncbi:LptF/LptG family permease [Gluconacetobacter diazotrophicus]|uniref:LptF/LptG family permease n=1 Tax=Gluconacetobacter diazotrophicus TaxID=33996 RepID=A0A7W4FE13_GLUDI|nr:LptF/LptG family permease [Gluconacetobacter diazotrophicus]MBB2155983.1 LptF/LptG family permease [Gluconacetobacter diazotrophicus]
MRRHPHDHAGPPIGGVLTRYLTRELAGRILTAGAILLALMEILALLEQLTPILERHQGLRGALYFMALHAPLLLGSIFPLAVLIGSLVMLVHMTTASEIAILRAAGLTTPALVRLMLPAVLGLGLAATLIDDQVTPRAELALARWWNLTDPHPEAGRSFWFRSGTTLVDVGYVAQGGRELGMVDVYGRDGSGRLSRVAHLGGAHYANGEWTGTDARSLTVLPSEVIPAPAEPAAEAAGPMRGVGWPAGLRPDDMVRLSMDTPPLAASTMVAMMRDRAPSTQPPAALRTALLGRALTPLTFMVMLLLAIPVVYIPPRSGTRSWLPVWCLGAGLLFVVFQGLLQALGNAGSLPALAATLPGIVIFTFAVSALMLRIEET